MQQATRIQTSFRLNSKLVEKLRQLAQLENRSLNNYVESLLLKEISKEPNATTLAAMQEAQSSKNLETLNINEFDNFVATL